MNSVDVVEQALSTMKFRTDVYVDNTDPRSGYIVVSGIKHTHKMFGTPAYNARVGQIGSDHVFIFAHDYEIVSIPGPVEVIDGEELTLYLADPEFFIKLKTAIDDHINWLSAHKI